MWIFFRLIPSNIAKYIDYAEKKRSNDIIVLHNIILIGRHKNSSFPRLLLPIIFFHRTRIYLILQFPETKAAKYRLHENDKSAFLTQHYSLEIAYAWDGARSSITLKRIQFASLIFWYIYRRQVACRLLFHSNAENSRQL